MNSAKQRIRARYEGESGCEYHAKVHKQSLPIADVVAKQRARKLQPFVRPDDSVFEFGVGTALNLRFLRCRRRIGYDISEAGRAVCEKAGIEFVTSLDDVDDDVSVAICHHTLEHVPDPLECLEQLRRLLPVNGRLIVCVPFETHRSYRYYTPNDVNRHLFSWNPLSLGNLVTAAGFCVDDVRISPFGYEQRLAPLCVRAGSWAYQLSLATLRALRPADEVLLRATSIEATGY